MRRRGADAVVGAKDRQIVGFPWHQRLGERRGSAFRCADLGIELEPREDHAAYLGSWLKVQQGDKRFIFTAAAHTQKAADSSAVGTAGIGRAQ